MTMQRSDKVNICKLVAYTVLSDLKLTPDESDILERLMSHFELTPDERRAAFQVFPNDNPVDYVKDIEDEDSKTVALKSLAMAVGADSEIADEEREIATSVGTALGFGEAKIASILKAALRKNK